MNRSGGLTIILLCGVLAGCATSVRTPVVVAGAPAASPHSDAYLLPTLMGSLAMLEYECATQIEMRPAAGNELRDVILQSIREVRAGGWPFPSSAVPCSGTGGLHCPDSKCPSMGFGDVICKSSYSRDISYGAAMKLLEMEILLRFAHEPSLRMMEYLDRRLRTTYDEVRARRR